MSLSNCVRALVLSAASTAMFASSSVQAGTFDNVFVFGDSLVDSGNAAILNSAVGAGAPLGYFQDRFTDGPSLGDWFAHYASGEPLGVPSLSGGNNFSYGDARIRDNTNDAGPGADGTPDLRAQVDSYLTRVGPPPGPNDLFIINAGGNDLRDLAFGVPDFPTVQAELSAFGTIPPASTGGLFLASAAQQLVDTVVALEFSGAENILLMLPPDTSRSPEAIAFANSPANPLSPEELLTLTRLGSEALRDNILFRLGLRDMSFAADLRTFDYLPFTDALIDDPAFFGLADDLNVTQACLAITPPAPDVDCSGFLFFDSVHPTSPALEQIALAALDQTFGLPQTEVSEPATLALLGVGLAGFVSLRRRRAA